MTLKEIMDTVDVPSYPDVKPENERPEFFAVFALIGQEGETYAEGKEAATGYTIALDYYSKGRPWPKVAEIRSALESQGVVSVLDASLYEQDTGYRHVALTLHTVKELL